MKPITRRACGCSIFTVNPKEVGYFDTTPGKANDAQYGGAWSDYPFFKDGVVGISSIEEGFFLVRFKPPTP